MDEVEKLLAKVENELFPARQIRQIADLIECVRALRAERDEALKLSGHDDLKWLALDFLKMRDLLVARNETVAQLRAANKTLKGALDAIYNLDAGDAYKHVDRVTEIAGAALEKADG